MNRIRLLALVFALGVLVSRPPAAYGQETETPSADNRSASPLLIGSRLEDLHRVRQVLGEDSTAGFLIRSVSSRLRVEPSGGWRWSLLGPELDLAWNSTLPFSLNEGALWTGRGASLQATAGVVAASGALSLVLAPQIVYAQNLEFDILPPADSTRSLYSSPWHVGAHSADLPLRFGDVPLLSLQPGQSSLTWVPGRVALGASTENQWWGPGIRNAIVMSNHASGIPHVFVRTSRPWRTRLGALEAKWMLGGLTESLFFDTVSANDVRSLSGFTATFRPAAEPHLTLGLSRVVYAAVTGAGAVPARALDAFTWWRRPDLTLPDSLVVDSAGVPLPAARPPELRDQILSLFGRWIFPEDGFEIYAELARTLLPASFRELVNEPNHTQGYTLGLQWVKPLTEPRMLRLQTEATYLEESPTVNNRPGKSYYVSRSIIQGYTHRGKTVGAAIGPGGSSQWIAGDLLAPRWHLGVGGGRIRWANDVYYVNPGRLYVAHDVSIFGTVRAGIRVGGMYLATDLMRAKRYNYLFQNPALGPRGEEAEDRWNSTLRLSISTAAPSR